MSGDLYSLLKILEDENERIAGKALSGIVNSGNPELDGILRSVKNTGSRRFRQRIREILRILEKRRRRDRIGALLRSGELSLTDALIYCHLFWYDNDTYEEMLEQWNRFLKESGKSEKPRSLRECLIHLDVCQFGAMGPDTDPLADSVCLGAVLDNGLGCDFLLCIIGVLLGRHWGYPGKVVTFSGFFAVSSPEGFFLPGEHWEQRIPPPPDDALHFWSDPELIALLERILFLNAVASNGFRYIRTIGESISGSRDLDFLPYPYGCKR